MEVSAAERQHVEPGVGEFGASRAVLGNEDVPAAFLVKDPADVARSEVV
jgi:hypothetical protein